MKKQNFNIFIAVDWSAKSSPSPAKPSADALWVGIKDTLNHTQTEHYFRTRHKCKSFLTKTLIDYADNKSANIVVGYDLDFGFPRGFAKALGDEGGDGWKFNWEFLSKHIHDNEKNANNRFEVASHINSQINQGEKSGPLWGCPRKKTLPCLDPTSPVYPYTTHKGIILRKKRWCEHKEPKAQPVWKLLGTASVGGQTLLGIPVINELRNHKLLREHSLIWPFETGFKAPRLKRNEFNIIHLEIWPGILSKHLDANIEVKDQAQVRAIVDWLHDWVVQEQMDELMSPPSWMTESMIDDAIHEEGWVIGAGREGNIFALSDDVQEPKQMSLF